jgi:hypothetical protein
VDLTRLSEGDDEYDSFVRVPVDEFHELTQRISDLKFKVQDQFGVYVTIMPIPVAS